jgi:hypothetical protein
MHVPVSRSDIDLHVERGERLFRPLSACVQPVDPQDRLHPCSFPFPFPFPYPYLFPCPFRRADLPVDVDQPRVDRKRNDPVDAVALRKLRLPKLLLR